MDIKNVKLVIFDMDGLMLDTEQCYYYGVKEMCEKKKIKAFNLLLLCSNENEFGYIIFIDHDRKRIWQPDEIALFVYFSRLLSLNLEIMTLKSKVK